MAWHNNYYIFLLSALNTGIQRGSSKLIIPSKKLLLNFPLTLSYTDVIALIDTGRFQYIV